MSFVNPSFLWAFAALSIPIIIHLFSFRRYKTVYFPNVLFLQEVKKESDSRTRIKHWLVLAARLLALSFLILAFAQPYLKKNVTEIRKGKKAISIYIDNSFSMQSLFNDVSLLETAKAKAREIISAYNPDVEFQILSNNPSGVQLRFVNRDQVNLLIDDVQISPVWNSLSEVIALQKQFLSNAEPDNKYAYILSDFQQSFFDYENIKPDSSIAYQYIKLNANTINNITIDSCWLEKTIQLSGETVKACVQLTNNGNTEVENGILTLEEESNAKAILNFNLKAYQSMVDTLKFSNNSPGWKAYTLRIQDYPITFDDTYYFTFESVERFKVMIINGTQPNAYLTAMFNQPQRFELLQVNVAQVPYDALSGHRLIVLNDCKTLSSGLSDALNKALEDGVNLLIVPSAEIDVSSYQAFLNPRIQVQMLPWVSAEWQADNFNLQHPIMRDLFEQHPRQMKTPYGKGYFPLSVSSRSTTQSILNSLTGQHLLLSALYGKGVIYISSIPFDKSANNFVTHALFAPILFKMCMPYFNNEQLAYTVVSNEAVNVPWVSGSKERLLKLINNQQEFLPQQRAIGQVTQIMLNQLTQAGIFNISENATSPTLKKIALNYNRRESAMRYIDDAELEKAANKNAATAITSANLINLTQRIAEHASGIPLWKYCITFALAFLVIESLLLKFFR